MDHKKREGDAPAASAVRKSGRKRPRVEWVSEEHVALRKRLRTMTLDEMAAHMLELKHQAAAAQAAAARSQTDGFYDEDDDVEDEKNEEEEKEEKEAAAATQPSLVPASFSDLPAEMIACIIARLAPSDVAASSETCRMFHAIVTKQRYAVSIVDKRISPQHNQLIGRFASLRVLSLCRVTLADDLRVLDMPQVTELYLTDMRLPQGKDAFLGGLTALKVLRMENVALPVVDDGFALTVAASLETLIVMNTPLRALDCPADTALKHLTYGRGHVAANACCGTLIHRFEATLETLECGFPNEMPALNLVALRALTLRDVHFSYMRIFEFLARPFPLGRLPSLERLELDTLGGMDESRLLNMLAPYVPALRELILTGNEGIVPVAGEDAVVNEQSWNTAFPHLETLHVITPCDTTVRDAFEACLGRIAHMTSLRHLVITNTKIVVDAAMLWTALCRSKTLRLETLVLGDFIAMSASDIMMLYDFVPTLKRISVYGALSSSLSMI
jgi:hypothetical protein